MRPLFAILLLATSAVSTAEDELARLSTLPQTLRELQAAADYREWRPVRVFSRGLKHFRLLRINDLSNVVISETGTVRGRVDVVEVILLPEEPEDTAAFAIYDPTTGKRLERYPGHIKFDIEGVPAGSHEASPTVCMACHNEQRPLNAVIPWTRSLQDEIDLARGKGLGIRQALVDPVPNDNDTRQRVNQFNELMRKRFPLQYMDLREWLQP